MKVSELIPLIDGRALTNTASLDREIASGYSCDLLSWVMAHGSPSMAWITVQTHMNVIAVATLHEMSCVIIPEGGTCPEDVLAKADEEGIAVIASPPVRIPNQRNPVRGGRSVGGYALRGRFAHPFVPLSLRGRGDDAQQHRGHGQAQGA